MGILSRAVFREVAVAAALGTALFTIVLFMQRLGSGKLFEVLLRGSATASTVLYLLALLLPLALIFALPTGTLVGVLIGLGRMSADGEVTALRAAGVPARRLVLPVLAYATLATAAAAFCSLWLNPFALREQFRIRNQNIAQQLTAEIQERVFEEQFSKSNLILYVREVKPTASTIAEWKNVFLADTSPPEERSKQGRSYGDAPTITTASSALAVPDAARNTIQLSMRQVSTHAVDQDPAFYHNTTSPQQEQVLPVNARAEESAKPMEAMDTAPLWDEARRRDDPARAREARLELHRRLALPVACLLLAAVGIPLGAASRRSGKSGALVITVFLAFLYFMTLISLLGLARQGRLSPELAAWGPNVLFGLLGLLLNLGIDRPGDRDLLSRIRAARTNLVEDAKALAKRMGMRGERLRTLPRIPLVPGVIDTWVLSTFLFWFAVLVGSFVLLLHVFIFFDLLGNIVSRGIAMQKVFTYHLYLTPMLLYNAAPMAVLGAVLITFAIMSKNNEVTAMKACGVSLYRLSWPVLATSALISGLLFAYDHAYIPEANRIQEGILAEIKGRPPQTWQRPDRRWIFGSEPRHPRIFFYKFFDSSQNVMAGVNVYELDESNFRLTRHINAESARWEPAMHAWVFQNGWSRDFAWPARLDDVRTAAHGAFQATTFPEIKETPAHFTMEVKPEKQLNFVELDRSIRELQQSGFNTVRLQVQYHKKFSLPAFAAVMALLALPFAFLTGNRGAMAGIGVSFGVVVAYFALGRLFEEIGNVNQLPAAVAAWAPVAVFTLAGMYLFGRMRT